MTPKNAPTPALLLIASSLLAQAHPDLAHLRDRNRVLLIFAPSARDPRWQRQAVLLRRSEAEFADRDLLRFDVFASGPKANPALRARYHVGRGQFRVLLIGKDGHVAYRGPTPVPLEMLTNTIDRMPMRREEMRRRGELR